MVGDSSWCTLKIQGCGNESCDKTKESDTKAVGKLHLSSRYSLHPLFLAAASPFFVSVVNCCKLCKHESFISYKFQISKYQTDLNQKKSSLFCKWISKLFETFLEFWMRCFIKKVSLMFTVSVNNEVCRTWNMGW